MRVAILLGVSHYDSLSDLPACKRDVDLMKDLITATDKFEKKIVISDDTYAAKVKEKLTNFIRQFEKKEIEEVLFYYTGHGDFFKDEFYYVLSNFKEDMRRQTCIENSEIDNWLRGLNPELTVKIVDACHSGITYVKGNETIEKYIYNSKQVFGKLFFMFSSGFDQSSYQDDILSFFTKSFVRSFQNQTTSIIRYKDIIDFISDAFISNSRQTPYFVTQASHTEIFCSLTPEIKELALSVEKRLKANSEETRSSSIELDIVKIVEQDAKNFFSEEDVMTILNEMKEKIENHEYPPEFNSLYDAKYSFSDSYWHLPEKNVIGEWIKAHSDEYFANVVEEKYTVKVPRVSHPLAYTNGANEVIVTKFRITGFDLTTRCPYKIIEINAVPKYPNISWGNLTIVFLLSKTKIRFFYFFSNYKEKNWDDRKLIQDVEWKTIEFMFAEKQNILDFLENEQNEFAHLIIEEIRIRYGLFEINND